jgi:hypothetical protein
LHRQPLGRTRELAFLGNRQEVAQVAKLHGVTSPWPLYVLVIAIFYKYGGCEKQVFYICPARSYDLVDRVD